MEARKYALMEQRSRNYSYRRLKELTNELIYKLKNQKIIENITLKQTWD